jgi:hypothetical protein
MWLQVRFQDPQFGPRVGYVQAKFVRRSPIDLSIRQTSPPAPSDASPQPRGDAIDDLREGSPEAGTTEIMALGSVTGVSAEGEMTSEVLLSAFTGVFANRHLEVGGTVTGYKFADSDILGSVAAVGLVNFPNDSPLLPFIGGGVGKGFGYSPLIGNPWYVDIEGGFRILTPRRGGALIIRPFYQRQFFSGTFGEGDLNLFGLALGASIFF